MLILEIADAFKLFDKNGDGQISIEELGEAMKQAGQEVSEAELKDMIKAVDRNGKTMVFVLLPLLGGWMTQLRSKRGKKRN